jgi:hypothetical protein
VSVFLVRCRELRDPFLRGLERQKQLEAISEVNVQLSAARIAVFGG